MKIHRHHIQTPGAALLPIFPGLFAFLVPILMLAMAFRPAPALALSGEAGFFKAEACYLALKADEKQRRYRHNWFPCIRMFEEAHKAEPNGRYAPANLYMTGHLYAELHAISGMNSDRKEALDRFQRVRRRYSDSVYAARAAEGIAALGGAPAAEKPAAAGNAEQPEIKRVRVEKAVDDTARREPPHKARDPEFKNAKRRRGAPAESPPAAPRPKAPPAAPAAAPPINPDELVTVTGLRVWSNPSYTRVVVDADEETPYAYRFLGEDTSSGKPQRLYIDFSRSRLSGDIRRTIPINDNLLIDARAGQYRPDLVRVVVDIKSFKNYKIFSLRNPFRTVIDVWGRGSVDVVAGGGGMGGSPETPRAPRIEIPPPPSENPANGLATQFALRVNRIVIDPGHGGHDPGAVGYYKGVYEKDIVLSLAHRLARKIRRTLGCEVSLTRSDDRFITLEERTAIANTTNADLFISLHTNAHQDPRANGIETYFLNLATDDESIRVAARENATSRKNISDLQTILNDLMKNAKINESSRLAGHVQKALFGRISRHFGSVNNKGVKQAPFYVLLGAQMPAILVETSFISNKRECHRLTQADYQEHLCDAILDGIRRYMQELNPTAVLWGESGG